MPPISLGSTPIAALRVAAARPAGGLAARRVSGPAEGDGVLAQAALEGGNGNDVVRSGVVMPILANGASCLLSYIWR
jgi:anti-sigma factor RsiW